MKLIYGLEYALHFGVPGNKLELWDGTSRWAFPFASRAEGEAHFEHWLETLRRWKQVEGPCAIRKSDGTWSAEASGIRIELFPRPVEIRFPIDWQAFDAFLRTFNRRDYWPGQPAECPTGWDSVIDDGDIRMNVWAMLQELSDRHGGRSCGRVDIALAPGAGISPDGYYYGKGRDDLMIGGDYFCAVPDLVIEVLSAPSRWLDRGLRMEVYRRAGVPRLWLVEPAVEAVETYELHAGYDCVGRYRAGEAFACDLFPGEVIRTDALFRTQSKRWPREEAADDQSDPIPDWIVPPETTLGLEYFFLLGHPERRWEFWNNRARSVLAFGSSGEARARLDHFLAEACRWEGLPRARLSDLADNVQQSEVGKFQFTRRGRLVFLDVAIDGGRHREILATWANRDAWDWGEG